MVTGKKGRRGKQSENRGNQREKEGKRREKGGREERRERGKRGEEGGRRGRLEEGGGEEEGGGGKKAQGHLAHAGGLVRVWIGDQWLLRTDGFRSSAVRVHRL